VTLRLLSLRRIAVRCLFDQSTWRYLPASSQRTQQHAVTQPSHISTGGADSFVQDNGITQVDADKFTEGNEVS
jgi:hypothetical protein